MVSVTSFCCPSCGVDLTIEQLFGHVQDQRAFAHLATISIPLGARVLAYTLLFAPPKNKLTLARKARLIEQLLPDLQRQAINHKGRDWDAPLAAWALAIDQMLQARDQGKLTLPLASHAYLYAVIAGMADKVERADESAVEADRRRRAAGSVLDEFDTDLQATQQAIAAKQSKPREFRSAAEVLEANPHLKKGTS
jgi:hypothetical protein